MDVHGRAALPHRKRVRLEAGEGDARRFWEIAVTGAVVTTRAGAVGTDGRVSRRVMDSAADAHGELERRVADRQRGGFAIVDEIQGEHAIAPELAAAILDAEDGDDEAAYLVYADWLLAQGDPRGELILLQHGLATRPHDAPMVRAERQHTRDHGARLLPPRLAEVVSQRPEHAIESGTCELAWRLGFVHRARIGRSQSQPPYTVRELMISLLDHPSGQLLRELVIGALGPGRTYDYRPYDYAPVVAALCEAAPAALRRLVLAEFAPEHVELPDSHLGDVSGLFRGLPRLRDVHLRGGTLELGEVHAPALERFCLTTPSLGPALLASLDAAAWPRLAELAIHGVDQRVDIDALPTLLEGEGAPALRSLAIVHTTGTLHIWDRLTQAPLMRQLESLDLSRGDLADRDVAAMMASAPALGHLRRLVLDGNYISRPQRRELRTLCREVSIAEQRGAAADLPRVTHEEIVDFAPDARSFMAAGDVADPRRWPRLGAWMAVVWGSYQGTQLYDVFVDIQAMEAGCTCPSSKYPCKHALGLLLLATRGRLIPVLEPPEGFVDSCRASRYEPA